MEVSGQLHAAAALLTAKGLRRLRGPQSRSGHFREQKNLVLLPGIKSRRQSKHNTVPIVVTIWQ
jgi:hypothetical protein